MTKVPRSLNNGEISFRDAQNTQIQDTDSVLIKPKELLDISAMRQQEGLGAPITNCNDLKVEVVKEK